METTQKGLEEKILENIIAIRKAKKVTQFDIAVHLSVNPSNYSKIESGVQRLSIDKLAKIAEYFEMDIVDLIKYPKKYVDKETIVGSESRDRSKVIIQLEIDSEKKEKVMKMVFGKNNFETLVNEFRVN